MILTNRRLPSGEADRRWADSNPRLSHESATTLFTWPPPANMLTQTVSKQTLTTPLNDPSLPIGKSAALGESEKCTLENKNSHVVLEGEKGS